MRSPIALRIPTSTDHLGARMARFRVFAAILLACVSAAAFAQERRADLYTGAITTRSEPDADSGSGDPLMSPEAIRSAAANFHSCLSGLWPAAARRGISRATFERVIASLAPDLHIMDLLDAQPEFTKPLWNYLDVLVTEDRIAKGRAILAKYAKTFDAVERAYGVDRYVIAAIWGVETNYGTQGGSKPVLQSTATLACIGRRQTYFRTEFLDALEIIQRGDL